MNIINDSQYAVHALQNLDTSFIKDIPNKTLLQLFINLHALFSQ